MNLKLIQFIYLFFSISFFILSYRGAISSTTTFSKIYEKILKTLKNIETFYIRYVSSINNCFSSYFSAKKYRECTYWAVINRALTHTYPYSPVPTHTQPKKGQTHPHPATPGQEKVTPIHTQPKKGHAHPHPPTISQKRSYPPKFRRKSMGKKLFHYPLLHQIYHKLKKS